MIKLYNTQSRSKEEFKSIQQGKVALYVCGPTVYNYVHLGNARTFLAFDVIRRYFMWRGFDVTFVQNITDVDDKIITKAQQEGRTSNQVAAEYTQAFIDDMHALGVLDPDIRPRATQHIPEMIALVEELIARGHAYESGGDVYFAVRSFASYGHLSGRNIDEMESGHRTLRADDTLGVSRKRDPLDFAVWKSSKPGEPSWDSPWGAGRPGWHIECSAMSRKYLGMPLDIHGGGVDLVFPHHENERAQSEAAYGNTFVNYWLHSGMLRINDEKMSKSLGNFLLLRDVLKTVDPAVLRFLMLQTHYRSPLDFSDERLSDADAALGRIRNAIKNLDWLIKHAADAPSGLDLRAFINRTRKLKISFILAMDDDFNTSKALGDIFEFIARLNTETSGKTLSLSDVPPVCEARSLIVELLGVFGINADVINEESKADKEKYPAEVLLLARELTEYKGSNSQEAMQALLAARATARAEKNWALADALRNGLGTLGLAIEDTPQGPRVVSVEDA